MTTDQPKCMTCAHWQPGSDRCAAYPQGIPVEIWYNSTDHTKVQPDQVGEFIYEPKPDPKK